MGDTLNKKWKWVSIFGKGVAICIALFFALISLFRVFYVPESYFTLYPSIDTVYASKYSEEKFDQIQIGMSENEVIKMLGEPLQTTMVSETMDGTCFGFRYPSDTTEIWCYTGDGACWFADFAWLGRWMYFDKNGKVTAKNKSIHYD